MVIQIKPLSGFSVYTSLKDLNVNNLRCKPEGNKPTNLEPQSGFNIKFKQFLRVIGEIWLLKELFILAIFE